MFEYGNAPLWNKLEKILENEMEARTTPIDKDICIELF